MAELAEQPHWSLAFTTGWIAERDTRRAQPYGDRSAPVWSEWRDAERRLAFCLPPIEPQGSITAAWRKLKGALVEGKITATGRPVLYRRVPRRPLHAPHDAKITTLNADPTVEIPDSLGQRRPIEPLEWLDCMSPLSGPCGYEAIFVARRDALALWPSNLSGEARKRTGPKSNMTSSLAEIMLADLRAGKDLGSEKQESLAAKYGVSRSTAVRALEDALSKFNPSKLEQ